MTWPLDSVDKDALIAGLIAQIETLTAANARRVGLIIEFESKLDQPPKTPDNSRVPLSKGQNDSGKDTDSVALLSSGDALGEPPALRVSGRHP